SNLKRRRTLTKNIPNATAAQSPKKSTQISCPPLRHEHHRFGRDEVDRVDRLERVGKARFGNRTANARPVNGYRYAWLKLAWGDEASWTRLTRAGSGGLRTTPNIYFGPFGAQDSVRSAWCS